MTEFKMTKIGLLPVEWEVKKLGEVFSFLKTETLSREALTNETHEGTIHYIHYGDIHAKFQNEILDLERDNVPFLKNQFATSENLCFLKNGDLIIADASEDYAGVGECVEITNLKEKKLIGGLHTIALRDENNNTAIIKLRSHAGVSQNIFQLTTCMSAMKSRC